MKATYLVAIAVTGVLVVSGLGHAQMGMGMMRWGGHNMSYIRHQFVMQHGIDPVYLSKENPLEPSNENLTEGKKLYDQNCSACHGPSGLGNGVAGKQLNPPPSNVAAASKMPMATDGYLYWTIAEGGIPLHTPMPAFKGALKEDQIWQIILYLRQL